MPTHTENVVGNLATPGDQGQGGGPYGTMPTHTENVVGNLATPGDQGQGGGPYGTMPTHTENVVGNLATPGDQGQGGGPYGTMPTHTENVVGNLATPGDQGQNAGPMLHATPHPPAPPDSGPTPDQGPDLAPRDAYGRVLPTAPAGSQAATPGLINWMAGTGNEPLFGRRVARQATPPAVRGRWPLSATPSPSKPMRRAPKG